MELVKTAEKSLGDLFKSAPKLPNSAKETLVKVWPWLAVIFGALQLFAAWGLYDLTRTVSRFATYFGTLLNTSIGYSAKDKFFIYTGIIVLLVDAAIMLMAYPKLVKRQKSGWDLLFLGSLLNVAYSVVNIFISGRGIGDFLMSLLGSVVAFYLLFQVKEKYAAKS